MEREVSEEWGKQEYSITTLSNIHTYGDWLGFILHLGRAGKV